MNTALKLITSPDVCTNYTL